jgi:hypothetical protein
MLSKQQHELAKQIRDECIQTAVAAYESAAMSGLCGEGAFEAAVSAMRMLDVEKALERRLSAAGGSATEAGR